jgi:hypothetical protein
MQSAVSANITGHGHMAREVNRRGSDNSIHFNMERVLDHDGEWDYNTPVWSIGYTVDGSSYHDVGTITAFPGDGIQATIRGSETVAGNDVVEVFEAAVCAALDTEGCVEAVEDMIYTTSY